MFPARVESRDLRDPHDKRGVAREAKFTKGSSVIAKGSNIHRYAQHIGSSGM